MNEETHDINDLTMNALQSQRNAALNGVAELTARLHLAQAEIADLKSQATAEKPARRRKPAASKNPKQPASAGFLMRNHMIELKVSMRGIMELVAQEGIVLQAYLDSRRVWTWGIGITNASGHTVHPRYLDKPQSLERVFEVYLWVLKRYEAEVLEAFSGFDLKEHELAGALSFHYNTGAIGRASWVNLWKTGDVDRARNDPKYGFMAWDNPSEIIQRRSKEADLFFDGQWTGTTTGTVWGVHQNNTPNWADKTTVDISAAIDTTLGASPDPIDPGTTDDIAAMFKESGADEIRRFEGDYTFVYKRK